MDDDEKRKREPELVDNVTYHSHDTKMETGITTTHHSVNFNVVTSMNKAYAATGVTTSPNPAYLSVASPRENVDIAICPAKNVAYVATDIAASVNPAYRPMQNSSDNTREYAYDYVLYKPVADVPRLE